MSKKKTHYKSLTDWIEDVSIEKVAKLMDVHPSGVRHWRTGHCLPRVDQMKRIKKITNGRLSYDSMIDGQSTLQAR